MLSILFLKYWKHLVIVLAIIASGYFVYEKIYSIGYTKASEVYSEKIAKYELDLNTRISNVEYSSKTLAETINTSNKLFSDDIKLILKNTKDKPLFIVNKEGKCGPSTEFVDTYNAIIERANTK